MVRMARLGLAMAPTLSLKVLTNFRLSLQQVEHNKFQQKSKPTEGGLEVVQNQPGGW